MAKQKKTTERLYNSEDLIRALQPRLTTEGKLTVETQVKDDDGKELSKERYYAESEEGMAIVRLLLGRLISQTATEGEANNAIILLRGRGLERPRIGAAEVAERLTELQAEATTGPPTKQQTASENRNEELLTFLEELSPDGTFGLPCMTPDEQPVIWLDAEEDYCPIPGDAVRAWLFQRYTERHRRPLTGGAMSVAMQWLMSQARHMRLEVLSVDEDGTVEATAADETTANPLYLALQEYLRAENVVAKEQFKEALATDVCNKLQEYARLYHPNAKALSPDPRVLGKYIPKNAALIERLVGVRFEGIHRENGACWRFVRVRSADDYAKPKTLPPKGAGVKVRRTDGTDDTDDTDGTDNKK